MRIRRAVWVTGLIFVASIAFAALLARGNASSPEGGDKAVVPARVRVAELRPQRLGGEVRAGGFLRAHADVTISAERAGRVLVFPVAEGAVVSAGAEVATLDDTQVAARLAEARAGAREASLDPSTPAATYATAQAGLKQAEHEYRLHHPTAPFDGVIEVHHVDAGEVVAPGTPLVDIVDASLLILDVDVDAEFIVAQEIGRSVPVEVDALGPSAALSGRITRIASRADRSSRRYRVEVTVDPKATALKPGMHAEARFSVPAGEAALYVPKAAARSVRGETGVFRVIEDHARWTPIAVEEVYHRPGLWRVASGNLGAGDLLVVSGFGGLRDGMPVEARP